MEEESVLPTEEMEKLRREVGILKSRSSSSDESDIKSTMSSLSSSINSLVRVFKSASEDLKLDTHDAVLVSQKLEKILERLDKVEVQNEKIAKGIVAVAEMIEDLQAGRAVARPEITQRSPMPTMQSQAIQDIKPLPSYNMPPDQKKRGLFQF